MADIEYELTLEMYRDLVADTCGDRVKGKANPYTSLNGNMFSFLDKAGTLCLRLSEEDRTAFVTAFKTDPVTQYGAVMKEYVAVPPQMIADPVVLKDWFTRCLAYAQSLPVKPTKKK